MRSRAFVLSGPGYLEDAALEARLSAMGFEVIHTRLTPGSELDFGGALEQDDLIFLRSSWEVSPENFLYARLLAKGLSYHLFDPALGAGLNKPKVIAVGRAALSALLAGWGGAAARDAVLRAWITHPGFDESGWQKVVSTEAEKEFYLWSLSGGRHFPDLSDVEGVETILESGSQAVAWRQGRSFFSFADCLSFFDNSQLEAFGYETLPSVKTNTELLQHVLMKIEGEQ